MELKEKTIARLKCSIFISRFIFQSLLSKKYRGYHSFVTSKGKFYEEVNINGTHLLSGLRLGLY
jgi:hypothetical protein